MTGRGLFTKKSILILGQARSAAGSHSESVSFMPYFKTMDGCSLYYELIGEGAGKPVITFVNGTLQTTVYWKIAAKALAGTAVDLLESPALVDRELLAADVEVTH